MLGGSLVAGVGSLGLAACTAADKAALGDATRFTPAGGTAVGDRQFVAANSFVSTANNIGPTFHSGWPAIEFATTVTSAVTSLTLPTGAAVVTVDLIWMVEDGSAGDARWIGGVEWVARDTPLDGESSATDWQAAVATVPAPRNPAITRLGDFVVNKDSPCICLSIGREPDQSEDTYGASIYLLGASISVVATSPFSVPPADVLLPTSVRLRGVNISPGPQHFYTPSVWAGLWQTWDWDTYVKPLIDNSKVIGANSIRTFGSTLVVTSKMISAAEYSGRWRQLLDYTASRGMYMFPCGGDLGHWGHSTTFGAAEDIYGSWSNLLAEYSHVVGVDITNEASTKGPDTDKIGYVQPEPWPDAIRRLGELVREVAHKPITHSRSVVKPIRWESGSIYTDSISDFLSIHIYYSPSRGDDDKLRAASWGSGKQLLVGEFGAGMNLSSSDRSDRYRAVKALVEESPRNVGALAWSGSDLAGDATPEDQMGLFDPNGHPRLDITSVFETFPASR